MNITKINISKNPGLRLALIIAGWVFVALGIIGAFLPVMPTTVFLILAAACFARSSERFYHWLLNNKLLGSYIKHYIRGEGMPVRAKVISIVMLNVVIAISIFFMLTNPYLQLLLAAVAVGVTIYILTIKTYRPEEEPNPAQEEA